MDIIAKLISGSLLSMYPTFVKKIDISFDYLLWSRMITHVVISAFFVNWNTILYYLSNRYGLLLSLITFINNYTAFKGISILESGIAISLIYTFPIFISLFSKGKSNYNLLFMAFVGVILLVSENKEKFINDTETKKGLLYIVIVVITSVLIYFNVKKIKTMNSWNHMFISYILGAIVLTLYLRKDLIKKNIENQETKKFNKNLLIVFMFHIFVGTTAHYLRLYSVTRLTPLLYSVLSYFSIVMGYVYGLIFNNETITFTKVIGSLLIIISNIMALL
jgi:drug/metabolite transporter (DMT)-like permease